MVTVFFLFFFLLHILGLDGVSRRGLFRWIFRVSPAPGGRTDEEAGWTQPRAIAALLRHGSDLNQTAAHMKGPRCRGHSLLGLARRGGERERGRGRERERERERARAIVRFSYRLGEGEEVTVRRGGAQFVRV